MRVTHDPKIEITPAEIKKALARPSDFGYSGDEDGMFETWALGPVIRTRDSGILDQSNAAVLIKHLEADETLADDWRVTGANHWAVGWVDHLSYRVIDADGNPTRIARVLKEWFAALSDYPVADDSDYNEREWEASQKWIAEEGPRVARKLGFELPEDWQGDVVAWWDAHRSSALESRDDQGASPLDEDYRLAFEALHFKQEEE